ncbi:hypothetical protein BR93DRAFT_941283 [Coniochaeta sp. PMI_546]|nr:hypothetical protein BR93DRAFT_941283 [Coniochaeta sp. PMI_546]
MSRYKYENVTLSGLNIDIRNAFKTEKVTVRRRIRIVTVIIITRIGTRRRIVTFFLVFLFVFLFVFLIFIFLVFLFFIILLLFVTFLFFVFVLRILFLFVIEKVEINNLKRRH